MHRRHDDGVPRGSEEPAHQLQKPSREGNGLTLSFILFSFLLSFFFFPFHSKESAFPVTGTSSETLSEFSLILKNSGSPGTFLAPESNDSGSAELGITSSVTWDGGCVLLVFS